MPFKTFLLISLTALILIVQASENSEKSSNLDKEESLNLEKGEHHDEWAKVRVVRMSGGGGPWDMHMGGGGFMRIMDGTQGGGGGGGQGNGPWNTMMKGFEMNADAEEIEDKGKGEKGEKKKQNKIFLIVVPSEHGHGHQGPSHYGPNHHYGHQGHYGPGPGPHYPHHFPFY